MVMMTGMRRLWLRRPRPDRWLLFSFDSPLRAVRGGDSSFCSDMPRGVNFPDLERKIEWRDGGDHSWSAVRSASSGDVTLLVERVGSRWRLQANGWLGVVLFRAGGHASREAAKKAAVVWWGTMTAADRSGIVDE